MGFEGRLETLAVHLQHLLDCLLLVPPGIQRVSIPLARMSPAD